MEFQPLNNKVSQRDKRFIACKNHIYASAVGTQPFYLIIYKYNFESKHKGIYISQTTYTVSSIDNEASQRDKRFIACKNHIYASAVGT
jgi:hypothetical protein